MCKSLWSEEPTSGGTCVCVGAKGGCGKLPELCSNAVGYYSVGGDLQPHSPEEAM